MEKNTAKDEDAQKQLSTTFVTVVRTNDSSCFQTTCCLLEILFFRKGFGLEKDTHFLVSTEDLSERVSFSQICRRRNFLARFSTRAP